MEGDVRSIAAIVGILFVGRNEAKRENKEKGKYKSHSVRIEWHGDPLAAQINPWPDSKLERRVE